jgi:hypothetical protein
MRYFAGVACVVLGLACSASAQVIVHPRFGGTIFGYSVDPHGVEGLLSEYLLLQDGNFLVASEAFSVKTGRIVKVIAVQNETSDSYMTLGVFGHHVAVDEFFQPGTASFPTIVPLKHNAFTGNWTPPIRPGYYLAALSQNLATAEVGVLTFAADGAHPPAIFGSDISANTFGPEVVLTDFRFCGCVAPAIAYDTRLHVAVVAAHTGKDIELALANATTGTVTDFAGTGSGPVNGIAVDPMTHIAVTTTGGDASDAAGVQFYNLETLTGSQLLLPCSDNGSASYPPLSVTFDPEHALFLVEQLASTCGSGSAIDVYDESGNLQATVTGFQQLSATPSPIDLHPSNRTGFILADPKATTLQSFSY